MVCGPGAETPLVGSCLHPVVESYVAAVLVFKSGYDSFGDSEDIQQILGDARWRSPPYRAA